MKDFRKLRVWHDAVALAVRIHKLTNEIRDTKRFAIVDQLERSSLSIASNIAEACGRPSDLDRARFIGYALGSNCEAQTQLEVARQLNLFPEEAKELQSQLRSLHRSLTALHHRMKGNPP